MSDDLTARPLPGYPPRVGTALWMLEDARRRTVDALDGLKDGDVDLVPQGFDNSIGSLLYHIAAIEADWLYADILVAPYPSWLAERFPVDVRQQDAVLAPVTGSPLGEHLERLAFVRERFKESLSGMSDRDYRRSRRSESGVVTPEWVLHHLCQHEAEHRGQIQSIRTALHWLPRSVGGGVSLPEPADSGSAVP